MQRAKDLKNKQQQQQHEQQQQQQQRRQIQTIPTRQAKQELQQQQLQQQQQNETVASAAPSSTQYSVKQYRPSGTGLSPLRTHRAVLTYEPEPHKKRKSMKNEKAEHSTDLNETDTTKSSTQEPTAAVGGGAAAEQVYQKQPLQMEFQRKKDEREKEIKEIQNMLDEIANKQSTAVASTSKPKEHIKPAIIILPETSRSTLNVPATASSSFRRSRTVGHIEPAQPADHAQHTDQSRARAKSTPRPETASIDSKKVEQNVKKRATNAKKFLDKERNKGASEKEQIKKRLEALKQSAKKILVKNMNQKQSKTSEDGKSMLSTHRQQSLAETRSNLGRKSPSANAEKVEEQNSQRGIPLETPKSNAQQSRHSQFHANSADEKSNKSLVQIVPSVDIEHVEGRNSQRGIPSQCPKSNAQQSRHTQLQAMAESLTISANAPDEQSYKSVAGESLQKCETNSQGSKSARGTLSQGAKSISQHSRVSQLKALEENSGRIGLLRKPETNDHSYSAIKEFSFDKENVARAMLTPRLDREASADRANSGSLRAAVRSATPGLESLHSPKRKPMEVKADESREKSGSLHLSITVKTPEKSTTPRTPTQVTESRNILQHPPSKSAPILHSPIAVIKKSARSYPQPNTNVIETSLALSLSKELELKVPAAKLTPSKGLFPEDPKETPQSKIQNDSAPKKPTSILKNSATLKPVPSTPQPSQDDFSLRIPSAFLKSTHQPIQTQHVSTEQQGTKEPQLASAPTTARKETSELPFWLKPSSVQVYPYNFIMAVRRKLEAIANPPPPPAPPSASNSSNSVKETRPKRSHQIPASTLPKQRTQMEAKRRLISNEQNSTSCSINDQHTKSQNFTDLESNFSSISLQLPTSNTVSEISSLKTESIVYRTRNQEEKQNHQVVAFVADDEVTTVSSSVFDSPEKKPRKREDFEFVAPRAVSPLSVKRIEHMQIKSKTKARKLSTKSETLQLKGKETTDNTGDVDLNQLLEDFNRSLSQVIQVNEQLKSTLDRSHQIFSPDRTSQVATGSTARTDYTTDFEPIASQSRSSGVKVNPVKEKTPEFQLDLRSVANSSIVTSQSAEEEIEEEEEGTGRDEDVAEKIEARQTQQTESQGTYTSPTVYEQHLDNIELLKANLRESIMAAKKNRLEAENASASLNDSQRTKHGDTNGSISHSQVSLGLPTASDSELIETNHNSQNQSSKMQTTNSQSPSEKPITESDNVYGSSIHSELNSQQQDSIHTQSSHTQTTPHENASLTLEKSQNSLDSKNASISEELPSVHGSPFSQNKSVNTEKFKKTTPRSKDSKQASIIQNNINTQRGDYPQTGANAENESRFFAAKQIKHKTVLEAEENRSRSEASSSQSRQPPPAYKSTQTQINTIDINFTKKQNHNEVIAIFNQSDIEVSIMSSRNSSISESSLNYSCVGLFEKLIKNETTKSEYLTALLKVREKALLDRTRGQLAWLEVQKERYKSKGLLLQITAIKKKQRGILMKMEREREQIKRLLQTTTTTSTTATASSAQGSSAKKNQQSAKHHHHHQHYHHHREHRVQQLLDSSTTSTTTSVRRAQPASPVPAALPPPLLPIAKVTRHSLRQRANVGPTATTTIATTRSAPIVRADYGLESSQTLEELLRRRESDLHKRRAHVLRLMQWNRKLDQEEAEVMQMERMLLDSNHAASNVLKEPNNNNNNAHPAQELSRSASDCLSSPQKSTARMERRLKEIDKSLQELQSIAPASREEPALHHEAAKDYVRTTGSKLNKLWRRLTAQQIEKFEPNRRYKLCKIDLERLYEEAKSAVLRDFAQDEERLASELLERSSLSHNLNHSQRNSTTPSQKSTANAAERSQSHSQPQTATSHQHTPDSMPYVPDLNLSHSSTQSERLACVSGANDHSMASQQASGTYSPSAVEHDHPNSDSSTHSMEIDDDAVQAAAEAAAAATASAASAKLERSARIERNVEKFLQLTHRLSSECHELQRSLSDTQLNVPSQAQEHTTRPTNQKNISTQSLSSSVQPINSADTMQSVQSLPTHSHQRSSSIHTSTPTSQDTMPVSSELSERPISTDIEVASSQQSQSRPSVICSVGNVQSASANENPSLTPNSSKVPVEEPNLSAKLEVTPKSLSRAGSCSPTLVTDLTYAKSKSPPTYEHAKSPSNNETTLKGSPSNHSKSSAAGNSLESADELSSYSLNFEQISTDLHSPSGCTLKSHSPQSSPSPASIQTSIASISPSTCIQSKTFTTATHSPTVAPPPAQQPSQSVAVDNYEADFESVTSNDETRIDDLSMPHFDATLDTTHDPASDKDESSISSPHGSISSTTFTSSTVTTPPSAHIKSPTISQAKLSPPPPPPPASPHPSLSPSKRELLSSPPSKPTSAVLQANLTAQSTTTALLSPPPPPPPQPAVASTTIIINTSTTAATSAVASSITASTVGVPIGQSPATTTAAATAITTTTAIVGSNVSSTHLMPDIINELEIRRCQQILIDNEQLKQYEHATAVPYMYVREIPNKPPPPYVPPEHGSPMTTIFPSAERIKDITYRRTHELYCELTKTDYVNEKGEKLPTVMSEKITNIYERIILDICREYLEEHNEILQQGDPINFHKPLQFFNPPDRLSCIQDTIYKEVRRCLAMDKTSPKRTQVYSIYGQRAKRDHIGKIIIQEMYDEDDKWCNFHREEHEVLDLIIEEMIAQQTDEIMREVYVEEGGVIEEPAAIEEEQASRNEETVNEISNGGDQSQSNFESYCNGDSVEIEKVESHKSELENNAANEIAEIQAEAAAVS